MVPYSIADAEGFRKRLMEKRVALGLSTRDLAEGICSGSYLSRIETGQRLPSLEVIQQLAHVLGVTPSWLISGRQAQNLTEVALQVVADYRSGVEPKAKTIDLLERLAIAFSADHDGKPK